MPDRRRPRSAPPGAACWRQLLAWLAVLAVLVQTTVPDFAMAARNAAQLEAAADADHCGADPSPDQPAPTHEHASPCAFCLALGTHGLAAGAGAALPAPPAYAAARPATGQSIVPPPLFLSSLGARAPPASAQV